MRRAWIAVPAGLVLAAGLVAAAVLRPDTTPPPVVVGPSPLPALATAAPLRTPLLATAPAAATPPSGAGVLRALQPLLAAPVLQGRTSLSVVDVTAGEPLVELASSRFVVPASTAKIVTGVAALTVLPPERRFATRAVAGQAAGDVVLVGGGDPTLAALGDRPALPGGARLADLVRAVKRSGTPVRRVVVDDALFSGPRIAPGWKPGYLSAGDVVPVTALALHDREAADPSLDAGRQLARALGARQVSRGRAPARARELARVSSPPVTDLVEWMLATSDNNLAEALGRHVALATRLPPTFDGATAAMAAALQPLLAELGVPARSLQLRDASGLSTLSRLQPLALSRLLALAARGDRYGTLLAGLPVAGFDGTLASRYRTGPSVGAAGQVRAKTGTLTGVSALAGLVRTRSGRLLAFDLTVDGLPPGSVKAPQALDAIAAGLAGCGCP